MIPTLFARSMRSCTVVMVALVAVALMYIASVVYLYDPAVSESLTAMQEAMPDLFAAFGMANTATTLLDFLINYLYGFLFTALLIVLAVYLAQKFLAGPVKDGSFAWILAAPHSRTAIIVTFVVAEVIAVAVVVALCWVGEVVFCEIWFPGELNLVGLARANGGLFVLGFFMTSLCFALTCVFKNPGLGLGIGAALCVLFFLMELAGTVGEGLTWVAHVSPCTLYDAYGLAAGNTKAFADIALVGAFAVILNILAGIVFVRRDFSL